MKPRLPILIFIGFLLLASCRGSRQTTKSDEKDLSTLINRLNKKGGDDKVIADIKEVYNSAFQKSNQRIENYQYENALQKWDKLIPELEGLQRMYDIISKNAYALRMVKPVNLYQQLLSTKDSAASDFYLYGTEQMQQQQRENLKEAYYAFEKASRYAPNYKNTKTLMKEVYVRAIVNVLINTIQYDDFGMNNWGWNAYNNYDRMIHSNIIRDLGAQTASNIPARFYDEYELRRQGKSPELVVDLVWRNLRFDYPRDYSQSYNRSKQIETGRDTANKPIYQTVTGVVYITRRELNANADMNIVITDAVNRTQIKWDRLPAEYRYTYEFAEYSGDRRALESSDLNLINRSRNQPLPTKEDAMKEMMQRIYNDLVSRIRNTANW